MLTLVSLRAVPEVTAAAIFLGEKKYQSHPTTLRNRLSEANTEQFCIYYSYPVLNRISKFLWDFNIFLFSSFFSH